MAARIDVVLFCEGSIRYPGMAGAQACRATATMRIPEGAADPVHMARNMSAEIGWTGDQREGTPRDLCPDCTKRARRADQAEVTA